MVYYDFYSSYLELTSVVSQQKTAIFELIFAPTDLIILTIIFYN